MAKQPDVPHPLLKCFLFFPLKHKAILPFCISFFFCSMKCLILSLIADFFGQRRYLYSHPCLKATLFGCKSVGVQVKAAGVKWTSVSNCTLTT